MCGKKTITSLLLSATASTLLFPAFAADTRSLNSVSYYVAYDSLDNTQYVLYMPSIDKTYTHRAGEFNNGDLHNISLQFDASPAYEEGELCFGYLTGEGSYGASTLSGGCYPVSYFFIQNESSFYLYNHSNRKLYEGVSGNPELFEDVTNRYPDVAFDITTSTLYLDGMPLSSSSRSSSSSSSSSSNHSIYIPGLTSSSLPTVTISSSASVSSTASSSSSSSSSTASTVSSSSTTSSSSSLSSSSSSTTSSAATSDAIDQKTYSDTGVTIDGGSITLPDTANYLLLNDSNYVSICSSSLSTSGVSLCSCSDLTDSTSCTIDSAIEVSTSGGNYQFTLSSTPSSVTWTE